MSTGDSVSGQAQGDGGSLVLLPGFMCDADLWTEVTPLLAPCWNAVHGDLFRDDTIPAMAARVLAAAPERFVAVGFSIDRQSVVKGKRWSVRVVLGGRRIIHKKKKRNNEMTA